MAAPGAENGVGPSSVVHQKSLYFVCHSGLDPESSVSELDSRLRGNDSLRNNSKKCWTHCTIGVASADPKVFVFLE
jgi:hypothetical protein